MLFGVGTAGSTVGGLFAAIMFSSALGRVGCTAVAGAGAMMSYAHFAQDVVNWRTVVALIVAEAVGGMVVLYLEQCCHRRDWLLMAMLPNVRIRSQ
jgi:uncharacterized membrane protein YfcA